MKKSLKVTVFSALAALSIATAVSAADMNGMAEKAPMMGAKPVQAQEHHMGAHHQAVKGENQKPNFERKQNMVMAKLAEAEQKGLITAEQKDKVIQALQERHDARKAQREKERAELKQKMIKEHKEDMKMVARKAGISEDVLKQIFHQPKGEGPRMDGQGPHKGEGMHRAPQGEGMKQMPEQERVNPEAMP